MAGAAGIGTSVDGENLVTLHCWQVVHPGLPPGWAGPPARAALCSHTHQDDDFRLAHDPACQSSRKELVSLSPKQLTPPAMSILYGPVAAAHDRFGPLKMQHARRVVACTALPHGVNADLQATTISSPLAAVPWPPPVRPENRNHLKFLTFAPAMITLK